ncbi:MAG: DnaJ domain-containing protein [Candidatus Thioglobus sp.]|jgi:DnaJ-class molecular chaperone
MNRKEEIALDFINQHKDNSLGSWIVISDHDYEVIGVDRSADKKQIKQAYKRLAMQWHPDRNTDNKEVAEKKFREILKSYNTLTDDANGLEEVYNKLVRWEYGELEDNGFGGYNIYIDADMSKTGILTTFEIEKPNMAKDGFT